MVSETFRNLLVAREDLAAVAGGADPSADRKAVRKSLTVSEVCDEYLTAARAGLVMTRFKRPKRASTIGIDQGRIDLHIKPLIGSVIATKLTPTIVQKMVNDIAVGKTAGKFKSSKTRGLARVGGGAGTARRVVELLGGIWAWGETLGYVSGSNPAHRAQTAKGVPKIEF